MVKNKKMAKEKVLDLENGFEIVISGSYKKHYNHEREILEISGTGGRSALFVREKKKKR